MNYMKRQMKAKTLNSVERISKVKLRHASKGRSIAAVLEEPIDYSKTRKLYSPSESQ